MAYGTTNGISNNLKDYSQLISESDITLAMVTEFREKADAKIDARLAPVVGVSNLPLVNPPGDINSVSDDMTTFWILRRLFMQDATNESDWVSDFWDKAMANLGYIVDNPACLVDASGNPLVSDSTIASNVDCDPIFGMKRTLNGVTTTGDYEESMEDAFS